MTKQRQIDYLEDERQKLWQDVLKLRESSKVTDQDIVTLKNEVKKKTSDYEAEAKNSARQAASNTTRTKNILKEAQETQGQLNEFFGNIKTFKDSIPEIAELHKSAKNQKATIDTIQKEIQNSATTITEKQEKIVSELEEAETNLANAQTASEEIDNVKKTVDDLHQKITVAHNLAINKNSEIQGVHNEIFGYTYEDEETGEEKTVSGTKEELDKAYGTLNTRQEEIAEGLEELKNKTTTEHEEFLTQKDKETEGLKNKIRGLLPDAMTAGLSHAYEKKRIDEESILNKSMKTFNWSIFFLSVTALIPIAIGCVLLYKNKSMSEVISDTPRIVFSILPIYLPLFWFAMSANRSVKLSKRLIEEYSHKETLSKTFEGLSSQINNLYDNKVSKDLRARLLYNIINASSENPGQLIKDFQNSDNPILSVLDKSLSFSKSLEKLSSIPGIELVLQKVVKKQEQRKDSIKNAVEDSIAVNDKLESNEE